MPDIERSWLTNPSRRTALARVAGLMAASPIAASMAQTDPRPLSEVRRALSLAEMQTAFDFEPVFFGNVPVKTYDYTAHGDGSEFTLRRNRQAFDWVDIVPRGPAIPASQVDLSSELLGVKMKFPLIVGPSTGQGALHPDGEIGMFRGATAASNTLMIIASGSTIPVAKVVTSAPGGTLWEQFYPIEDLAFTQRAMDNYQTLGLTNIMVTVDQQAAYYERDEIDRHFGGRVGAGAAGAGRGGAGAAGGENGEGGGGGARAGATGSLRYRVSDRRLWYSWQYIDALRKMVKGKLLIKGILDPQDARLAIEHGADGITVSNHGGRSMDYGPSTLEVLPEIVAEVNGRIPVLFDSGIRRGADIFKALALGANGVQIGRTARWGLAAFGTAGAQRVIEILQQELVQAAAACGCAKLSDINKMTVKAKFV
ncbi:MAG TPA: alpha-hydroxy acid oxidase [Rhizomicrobium sp.]|nr:alpha-hydroxy acid oxidase [Rhizomicrobium sp.]